MGTDYSAELAQGAAFTPEQMAQLLFSIKAVMEQQQHVLADFPAKTHEVSRLLNSGQRTAFTVLSKPVTDHRSS